MKMAKAPDEGTSAPDVAIRSIMAADTLDIRQAVLWPGLPRHDLMLEEDAEGTHFGAFVDGEIVAIISLFRTPHGVRFRKFATLSDWRGNGIGTRLLRHALSWAQAEGADRIWCDARLSAKAFYERLGFEAEGNVFQKAGVAYIVMARGIGG